MGIMSIAIDLSQITYSASHGVGDHRVGSGSLLEKVAIALRPCRNRAVKALIVANAFLEPSWRNRAAAWPGYARGMLPRDRKDWYD
jgi:hypothetical protein